MPVTDTDLAFASIEEIAGLFRKRKLSPVELTKLMLARIEQLNPRLNAYITVTAELALAQAKKAETELLSPRGRKGYRDRGPLHGIPISLKDNIYTAGVRTTAGSKILENFVPEQDAALAAQLKASGAVLLGKTNLHEFAYGVTNNNPHFGPARNPWDLSRIPGGSSGGSAAAVAAGLCYASIGTDTGGSIRIPASLCGVVGLKPTLGRVSVDGVIPLSPKLDCVGPLARTVRDAVLVVEPILAAVPGKRGSRISGDLSGSLRNITLGIPREFFLDVVAPEVRASFDEAVRVLRKQGAKLKPVSVPLLSETEDAGNQIAWPEATHYHAGSGWFPSRAADYGEDVRARLEMGAKVPATAYLAALDVREKFIRQLRLALESSGAHALAVPSTAIAAPRLDEETIRIGEKEHPTRALLLRTNRPANLAGIPAISVPCGLTSERLPVGLQLIGGPGDEGLLLQIARRFERACPFNKRPPLE